MERGGVRRLPHAQPRHDTVRIRNKGKSRPITYHGCMREEETWGGGQDTRTWGLRNQKSVGGF